ncbi:MAG: gliding motility protein GldL [Alloprevotella sp.]
MAIKINLVVRLQHWMDSVPGQTFLNYAYSWGASIVILGALFKLTHLPGGNFMLFIGMGTEVVVFFLSAFDRPFDKTEIGKELPHDYETDEEIAAKLGLIDEDEYPDSEAEGDMPQQPAASVHVAGMGQADHSGGVVIVGGLNTPAAGAETQPAVAASKPAPDVVQAAAEAIAARTPQGEQPFENEAQRLAEIIRLANDELLRRAQAALSPDMEQATEEYIEKLRTLAETFQKVDEQSARLAHDSEEMANLNRTLTAINKTYELHFKSISQQVGTIEQINEQTRMLAKQIEELNGVYGRMIQALTVNMRMQQPEPAATAQ